MYHNDLKTANLAAT